MKIIFAAVFLLLPGVVLASETEYVRPDSVPGKLSEVQRIDSLLATIDELHDKAREIERLSEEGFNLKNIRSELPQVRENIALLRSSLLGNVQMMDMKSLQTFALVLSNTHDQLDTWRKKLIGYSQQLINLQVESEQLKTDTLLSSYRTDRLFSKLYTNEIRSIDESWKTAKAKSEKSLQEISGLQSEITMLYYESDDLQKGLNRHIADYSSRSFKKEYPYIWQSGRKGLDSETLAFFKASVNAQKKLITGYIADHILYHLFLALVIAAGFIYWVRRNYQTLEKADKSDEWNKTAVSGALSMLPVLPALILVFNLAPFFDFNPPAAYVNLLQFLLFLIVSVFIYRNWSRTDRIRWTKIGASYILFLALQNVLNPGISVRLGILFANAFFTVSAFQMVRDEHFDLRLSKFARFAIYVFLTMNILAMLLNVSGRVTLSKALGNAAIAGYVQMVTLSLFVLIMKSAFLLNAQARKAGDPASSGTATGPLNPSITRILHFVVVVLWLIVFTSNMNVYNAIIEGMDVFFFTPRTVGSTTFTIGNIALFFGVLWLSAWAQGSVGTLFGEKAGSSTYEGQKKGSKTVIIKLAIIIIGFMIALMVSGLPIDKITVVIGAFGVGIGLGLQNIVNNFVSGVILIFERPLEIGDYVEMSGYKGWVKDIGIRATRLSNGEGADILVPNGAILSGNLVNWTLNNAHKRLEILIRISSAVHIDQAKEIIQEILYGDEAAIRGRMPEVYVQSVGADAIELKIWFWINSVARQESARSNFIHKITAQFRQQEIQIL
ncbi:MAG: mechanosensitive ion channel [Mucilaginibacter polytrichastri]|nr:mechanosensitive ion channel [Mucilaginibacter polytrichastri]